MKETIEVLNGLKEKALIEDYAVGGGIATIFYTEPVFTYDLDVFIIVKSETAEGILSLTPIYDYLAGKGCAWKGEHILIGGLPVQFLPVESGIEKEAVDHAREITYGGVKTKILPAEYLIAIALKVGRRKDFDKVDRLIDQAKIDKGTLESILKKHQLLDKFKKWEKGP